MTSGSSAKCVFLKLQLPVVLAVCPGRLGGAAAIVRGQGKALFWTKGLPMSLSRRAWQVVGTATEKRHLRVELAQCRVAAGPFSFLADSVPPLPSTLRLRGLGVRFVLTGKGRPWWAE